MVAVLVLGLLMALVGMLALVAESGYIYTAKSLTQTAVDAAAIAAVRQLQKCEAGTTEFNAAKSAAQTMLTQNPVMGQALTIDTTADVRIGRRYPFRTDAESDFVVTSTQPNSVEITLHHDEVRNGPLTLSLASLFGLSSVSFQAKATASRNRRIIGFRTPGTERHRLIPVAVSDRLWTPVAGNSFQMRWKPSQPSTDPGGEAWGVLTLVSNGFTTSSFNSNATLLDQVTNGFDGDVILDVTNGSNTNGTVKHLDDPAWLAAFQSRIGKVSIILWYDTRPQAGNDGVYHVKRFVPIQITSVVTTGVIINRGIFATVLRTEDDRAITDPNAPEECLISKIELTT